MPARILIVKGFLEGRTYDIPDGGTLTIGRGPDNIIQILETSVSRHHCQIAMDPAGAGASIRDLGSSYGTRVNDEPISEKPLADADRIALGQGNFALEFHFTGPARRPREESHDALARASTAEIVAPQPGSVEDESEEELVLHDEETRDADPQAPAALREPDAEKPTDADLPAGPTLGLATTGKTDPWIGKTLASYEIQERLGEGSVGVVYRAVQPRMDRTVALKLLQIDPGAGPSAVERFLQNARISGQFQHSNIVALYDAGQAHGCYYLAMEYIDGESVGSRLNRSGPLSGRECLRIAMQMADALQTIHAAGVVHGDIKPDSILLTANGDAKLTDLNVTASLHSSGILLGPAHIGPHYMAPEQFSQPDSADHRADLYSLGATLYKMLTGRAPFSANSIAELMQAIQEGTPTPLNELCKDTPPLLAQLVDKLLEKDPADRHQSAAEVRGALRDDSP